MSGSSVWRYRRQEPVDGCRADREPVLTHDRVERQMAVAFPRRDQVGPDRSETFPTGPIGGFPEDDERLAGCLRIDPPSRGGRLVDKGIDSGEESNCMLAMTVGDG